VRDHRQGRPGLSTAPPAPSDSPTNGPYHTAATSSFFLWSTGVTTGKQAQRRAGGADAIKGGTALGATWPATPPRGSAHAAGATWQGPRARTNQSVRDVFARLACNQRARGRAGGGGVAPPGPRPKPRVSRTRHWGSPLSPTPAPTPPTPRRRLRLLRRQSLSAFPPPTRRPVPTARRTRGGGAPCDWGGCTCHCSEVRQFVASLGNHRERSPSAVNKPKNNLSAGGAFEIWPNCNLLNH
jgi:hypothetical protein